MLARFLAPIFAVAIVAGSPALAHGIDGALLYARHCERCHGVTGRGDGPEADLFVTRPRDLQSGFLAR